MGTLHIEENMKLCLTFETMLPLLSIIFPKVEIIPQEQLKIGFRSTNISRKLGLTPGFTIIRKCVCECDGIASLHTKGKGREALEQNISFALISRDL